MADVVPELPPTRIAPVHGRTGTARHTRMRLGEALVAAGVLDTAQLAACLAEQERDPIGRRRRLGDIVVGSGLATEVDVARGVAAMLGFEYVDPADLNVSSEAVHSVPETTASRLRALPFERGENWLRVAIADPTDRTAVEALRKAAGVTTIALSVATPTAIATALERSWSAAATEPRPEAAPAGARGDAGSDAARGSSGTPAPPPVTVVSSKPAGAPPYYAAPEPAAAPASRAAAATAWEYLLVGDGMPLEHPGYTSDVMALERRLADLGGQGWEAVGVHANGTRMRVLLKRAR